MALAGRVGDTAVGTAEQGAVSGPADAGAQYTFVNGQQVLRTGDTGLHGEGGQWQATEGSRGVFIEGRPAHRQGDATLHTGDGKLAQGSPNTDIGDYGGQGGPPRPHDIDLQLEVRDAADRLVRDALVRTTCPHPNQPPNQRATDTPFSGQTTVAALCTATPVTVLKTLQTGTWDQRARSGGALPESVASGTGVRWFHAPAPETNVAIDIAAPAQRQITIPRAEAPRAVIRMTTTYNWMELVYRAFGLTMPTGANQLALLGVREGVIGGDGNQTTRDDDFESDPDHNAREAERVQENAARTRRNQERARGRRPGPAEPMVPAQDHRTRWDDLLFTARAPTAPETRQVVEVYECTLDPGFVENDAPGTPLLREGYLYKTRPSTKEYDHQNHTRDNCLQVFTSLGTDVNIILERVQYARNTAAGQHGGVTRTNHRTFREIEDAHVRTGADEWSFCRQETNGTILIHWGGERDLVTNWSSGCTVLRHARAGDRYQTSFKVVFQAAANRSADPYIPYLVVSSRYVKPYAEWVREVDQHPDQVPQPASVIRRAGLESPTGVTGQYVPSTMTRDFANQVQDRITELTGPTATGNAATNARTAANLRASLDLALFRVSI